jgi:hypothetical protein
MGSWVRMAGKALAARLPNDATAVRMVPENCVRRRPPEFIADHDIARSHRKSRDVRNTHPVSYWQEPTRAGRSNEYRPRRCHLVASAAQTTKVHQVGQAALSLGRPPALLAFAADAGSFVALGGQDIGVARGRCASAGSPAADGPGPWARE